MVRSDNMRQGMPCLYKCKTFTFEDVYDFISLARLAIIVLILMR